MRSRSHIFLLRDGKMLVLRQANGVCWEQPGGEPKTGETPAAAAIRETMEETGLAITEPELLRCWTYRNRNREEVRCFAYAARAPDGDVRLSEEHRAYEWMTAESYAARYCSVAVEALVPEWARIFLTEMRLNCVLFAKWSTNRRADQVAES